MPFRWHGSDGFGEVAAVQSGTGTGWGRAKVDGLFRYLLPSCLAVMFDKGLSTTIEVIKCKKFFISNPLRVK
jgi:hypothetical protein